MLEVKRCKRHGCCGSCCKTQSEETPIFEIRASTTGCGWTTIMLCKDCMIELMRKIPKTLREELITHD